METRPETITITIDGREVECRPGELIIEVAKRAGIYIPYFCYHPRMDPVGACRMCLCRFEPGPPKPMTACTSRVQEGMRVETQFTNSEVRKAQEGVLEFLLINHPLDCPICDRGGECPLQDQAQDYGPSDSTYIEPKRRFRKPVPISPLIKLDRERCILCYRCTRFCEELSGDTLIGVMDRGAGSYIYPFEGEDFDSYFSGNTVQICPVGALTSTPYRFQARPWDNQVSVSTCNLCASGCSLAVNVRVQDGKVVRFSGGTNEDTNEEWLCDKGRYGHAYISSVDRLTRPQVRREGELVAVSWDEAFRSVTDHIGRLLGEGRGDEVGLIVGGGLCDEDAYAAQKLARVVCGTNSVDHRLEGGMHAEALVPPQLTYDELLGADHVLVASCDLREELPIVFLRLRIAATRGLPVSVVHPRAVALTELSTAHLAPLPGTEAQIGAALAAALDAPVAAGAEALAAAADVPASDVRALAASLREAARPVILIGPRVVSDPDAVRAWRAVAAASGAKLAWLPRRAGEYGALASGAHPELLPGWRLVSDEGARSEVERMWGTSLPTTPGLDVKGILERARDRRLAALWCAGADLGADVPDARLAADALAGASFVVVQDLQESAMLAHADLVLPAAAFVEREGTFTDWEGRRQPTRQAVDPPGAARADYAIFAEAARRLGRPMGCRTVDDVRAELGELLREDLPIGGGGPETVRTHGPDPDTEYPLRLLTYRLLYDEGSRAQHTAGVPELTQAPFAEVHPDDARAGGIDDGATVRVASRHGDISVPVRVSTTVRPGVVFVPYRQPGVTVRDLCTLDDPVPAIRLERA